MAVESASLIEIAKKKKKEREDIHRTIILNTQREMTFCTVSHKILWSCDVWRNDVVGFYKAAF